MSPAGGTPFKPTTVVAAVAIVIVGIALYWFFGRGGGEALPPPDVATEAQPQLVTPPEPIEPEPEPLELPAVDESDSFVRDLVAALSSHPGLAAWLVSDGLIRRFVVVIDNVADGRNPSQHIQFMRPDRRFAVTGEEPNVRIDPRSYHRYDAHTEIVASLDADGTAELYLMLEPLISESYAELGYPDTRFRDTLERAVMHLLETPLVDDPPAVVRRATFYELLDDRLESLTPVQRQFVGTGPDNMRTVQGKLRSIANAIGIRTD